MKAREQMIDKQSSPSRYMVFDDVMSVDEWHAVSDWFLRQPLTLVGAGEGVRRVTDGPSFVGDARLVLRDADVSSWSSTAESSLVRHIFGCAAEANELLRDDRGTWNAISLAPWSYPVGSQLGWHSDHLDHGPRRLGAFILYTHGEWGPSWGGELLVVDAPATLLEQGVLRSTGLSRHELYEALDSRLEQQLIYAGPDPVCLFPLPGRLVILSAGTLHTIRRVDPSAGDRLRSSVSGFFIDRPSPSS